MKLVSSRPGFPRFAATGLGIGKKTGLSQGWPGRVAAGVPNIVCIAACCEVAAAETERFELPAPGMCTRIAPGAVSSNGEIDPWSSMRTERRLVGCSRIFVEAGVRIDPML